MDVNDDFVRHVMAKFNVTRLIHGHTHRQNIHRIPPHFKNDNQTEKERIVLGDWHANYASILEVNPQGYRFKYDKPSEN